MEMSHLFSIRLVKPEDAKDMLNIYRPIVMETATSFETNVPSEVDFKGRIATYSARSPWLVAEYENKVIGYAYATNHRSRQAYQWNQEVTVYVHPDHRKQGVAKSLYTKLLEMLAAMGFSMALAIITLPNEASISFHKQLGFNHIGDMKHIGYKLGRWHDTSWWNLELQPQRTQPQNIPPLDQVVHLL